MGCRDDFYIVGNIIGYTGKAHSDPTVYFQHGDEYGHITQNHGIKENIGREKVGRDANYSINNEMVDGSLSSVERTGPGNDGIMHTSRSKFVSVLAMSSLQKNILARSIYNFTSQKKLSSIRDIESYIRTIYGAPTLELYRLDLIPANELF
jgi:hypothetical protein